MDDLVIDAAWSVTAAMQNDFVHMSGDSNPLHTDPTAARRLPFGRPAVHGIHLVLDALERFVWATDRTPCRVAVTFRHPVGLEDPVTTRLIADVSGATRAALTCRGVAVADVTIESGELDPRDVAIVPPPVDAPEVHSPADVGALVGSMPIAADVERSAARFPRLTSAVGPTIIAELLGLSRLVGMHVPGLHSLFSSFDVTIGAAEGGDRQANETAYQVRRFDDRFAQATIDVVGPNVTGTLRAFVRAAPTDPDIGTIRPEAGEFEGQRWLIAGGSRGLGAMATLLLDAGGAEVRATYRVGAEDAGRLVQRTERVSAWRLDVLDPADDLAALGHDGWSPTHLGYFASPPIFVGSQGTWSPQLAATFRAVYVDGFRSLVDSFASLHGVLWPSSEAVDSNTPGLAEYAAVKHEGEAFCRLLGERGIHCWAPRLPRLRTDQTASFVPVDFGDAPSEVLAALRATSTGP